MEYLFALLTAVCLWLLCRDVTRGRRRILAQTGGGLLLRIRRTHVPGAGCGLHFLALVSGSAAFVTGDPAMLFICTGAVLWAIEGAFHPRNYVELRERGMVLAVRGRTALVPWRLVLWEIRRGRLVMELPGRRESWPLLLPERVDALTQVLVNRGEVRDASGGLIAPTVKAEPPKAGDGGDGNDANQAGKESDKVVFAKFQFTLRTIFISVLAASAAASWISVRYRRSREEQAIIGPQQAALDQLISFKPVVFWDGLYVSQLDFSLSAPTPADDQLKPLEQLTGLRHLMLCGPNVTDAGLVHLSNLRQLESVWLPLTGITDAGLVHLRNLDKLESLSLVGTSITDAGLIHLKNLTQLKSLDLSRTPVTDAGLPCLHTLSSLERIDLSGTRVTNQGVAELRRALPRVEVIR